MNDDKVLFLFSIAGLFAIFFAVIFGSLISLSEEKTKLEIERLKYELKIYKEQEVIDAESLK